MSESVASRGERERKLAIMLSRIPLDERIVARARDLAQSEIEWRSVMDEAARLQVDPAVLGNLKSLFAEEIGPELLDEVVRREQIVRANALSQTLRVVDVYKNLKSAGVPALVLKGPAISVIAYGDPSRRSFSDIDLIVKRKDLPAAQKHLEARGYRPLFDAATVESLIAGQHALEFEGPGPHVELHWALLPRHLKFDLLDSELWNEAITIECGGTPVQTIAPHHLFLYLCAHGAKHEWMTFRWICDVAQLARTLTRDDAAKVIALADRTNTRRIVALALRLVRDTFGDELSCFPPGSLDGDDTTDRLASVVSRAFDQSVIGYSALLPASLSRLHPYAEPLAFWIMSRERLRDRISCVTRFVFEPAPGDRQRSATSVFLRPLRLAGNVLIRVVRR
ncbi:MAG TPA: nucleotidyltransferase family protein [Gemmatimonadaceae bacterium]|jgi:hypothetical protein|nr:nucleotidyltransferase family protein [Gemmatimonadaceae bacterium]